MSPAHFSRQFRAAYGETPYSYLTIQEPIDQGYGVRDRAFRDPSGNQLRFAEKLG